MDRPHDVGGKPAGPIDTSEYALAQWEKNTHALMGILSGDLKLIKGGRVAIERIPPDDYAAFSYYERWIAAIESQLIDAEVLTKEEIDQKVQEMAGN